MQDEYVAINKTYILKRIEELESESESFIYNPNKTNEAICNNEKQRLLKQILCQSYPIKWDDTPISDYSGQWKCEASSGYCDYEQEDGSYDDDCCRYCGQPEERK